MTELSKSGISILHIVQSFDVSGRSRVVHDLGRRTQDAGYGCCIAVLNDECGYQQGDIEVICLGKRAGFDFLLVPRIARLARSKGTTILHSHGRGAVLYAALASRLARGAAHVHTIHRADGDITPGPRFLRRRLLGGITRFVAVSAAAGREFSRANNVPARDILTVYNGVDVSKFNKPAGQHETAANQRMNGSLNHPVIGTVANLSSDKDAATLLKAFVEISRVMPGARLKLAGSGPEAANIRELVSALGVADRVDFLGFRDDIPELLSTFDVFVLSTRSEGLGIAVLEAMAAKVPVVASGVGGILEIVEDGVTGRLFNPGDVAGLARAVKAVAGDSEMRAKLVAQALASVRERFSLEQMCEKYAAVYEKAGDTVG